MINPNPFLLVTSMRKHTDLHYNKEAEKSAEPRGGLHNDLASFASILCSKTISVSLYAALTYSNIK